jgi:hypothetical protein
MLEQELSRSSAALQAVQQREADLKALMDSFAEENVTFKGGEKAQVGTFLSTDYPVVIIERDPTDKLCGAF